MTDLIGHHEALHDERFGLKQHIQELEAALREIAGLVDGQEGRTSMTMQMHGFSPIKALGQARDIARAALQGGQKK